MTQSLNTSSAEIYKEDSPIDCFLTQLENDMMDENDKKPLAAFLAEAEVKIVWREEEKTKVGRGMITNDDDNFVYLKGEKGTVIVNKKDIIAIKQ
jgi:predicted nucleotidyltransferase